MPTGQPSELSLTLNRYLLKFLDPSGLIAERKIEIRTQPITGRTCRIAFSRIDENEPGTESLLQPPPDAGSNCPMPVLPAQVSAKTPQLHPDLSSSRRLARGESLLFPNLFPYGSYSAVSLFDDTHFVEIGNASADAYANSFLNCSRLSGKNQQS